MSKPKERARLWFRYRYPQFASVSDDVVDHVMEVAWRTRCCPIDAMCALLKCNTREVVLG